MSASATRPAAWIISAAGLSMLLCAPLWSDTACASPADEAAILKIEQTMTLAQNAETVVESWDNDVVWYELRPGEIDGLDAAHQNLIGQYTYATNVRSKILRIKVVADGRIGYAYSTQNIIADGKNGAPALNIVIRETDIFEKKNHQWKLVHQHLSVPVDLTSGKAIYDSK